MEQMVFKEADEQCDERDHPLKLLSDEICQKQIRCVVVLEGVSSPQC